MKYSSKQHTHELTKPTSLYYLVIRKLSGIIQWWYKPTKLKPTGVTGGALDIFYTHELNIKHSSTITGPLGTDNCEKNSYLGVQAPQIVNGWKKQLDLWNIPYLCIYNMIVVNNPLLPKVPRIFIDIYIWCIMDPLLVID